MSLGTGRIYAKQVHGDGIPISAVEVEPIAGARIVELEPMAGLVVVETRPAAEPKPKPKR